MTVYIAYSSLIRFLEREINYPGDEICDLLKNIWRAKDEILPVLKEQINNIIKDLDKHNLCPKYIKDKQ